MDDRCKNCFNHITGSTTNSVGETTYDEYCIISLNQDYCDGKYLNKEADFERIY